MHAGQTESMTEKPHAGGEWTKARFFGFLRSNLRKASMKWPPLQQVRVSHRRPSQSANKRLKWELQCFACLQWYPGSDIAVDHIIPCGSLKDWADIEPFVRRLFVEECDLALLCKHCHEMKPQWP